MRRKRKTYDEKFRAKVALEAAKGNKTLAELSVEYKVHANLICQWKKELLTNLPSLFTKKSKNLELEELKQERDELFKEIGKLQVEKEFLKKKLEL